jgi:heme oxygenase
MTTATPVMPELKNATQALHDATEHGTFNKRLVMGLLPREAFVEMLGQLFLMHRALETKLSESLDRHPEWKTVVRDYQFQEPYLRDDLTHFGVNPESVAPLAATTAFVDRINEFADKSDAAVLGAHYVFEGSNNGSRYIARALRRAYDLTDAGLRYFDPYGENQTEYWSAFKDAMNNIAFSPEETQTMIDAACRTFESMGKVHEELGRKWSDEGNAKPAAHGCPAMRPS